MSGDLTTSAVARQNILNNPYAIADIESAIGIRGIAFEDTHVVLKEQVADFFEVSLRTVESYCAEHADELTKSGYAVVRGNRLKLLKKALIDSGDPEVIFGSKSKVQQLSIFTFRAFLNLAMLLPDSQQARVLRQVILDTAINTVSRRTGGSTKYINQRDEEYLPSAFAGESYRKQFTDALRDVVDMGNFKYAVYTDKIYQAIFHEKAKEYRNVLRLDASDSTRSTFYAEILDLIASLEYGIADALRSEHHRLGRLLTGTEANQIFKSVSDLPVYKPLMERARTKMASRDFALRDAHHEKLKDYIASVPREDFERFLGEQSKELAKRIDEARDVIKRLKDR